MIRKILNDRKVSVNSMIRESEIFLNLSEFVFKKLVLQLYSA